MKKIVCLILALVMCAAFFAACGDSNSNTTAGDKGTTNNGSSNNGASNSDTTKTSIVGTWAGNEADLEVTYTFKTNGTFSANYASGTYTISGDKITLTANVNGQEMKLFDNAAFSIEGNTLKMGDYTYTKQ